MWLVLVLLSLLLLLLLVFGGCSVPSYRNTDTHPSPLALKTNNTRKKRAMPDDLASQETVSAWGEVSRNTLHKTSPKGITCLDLHPSKPNLVRVNGALRCHCCCCCRLLLFAAVLRSTAVTAVWWCTCL